MERVEIEGLMAAKLKAAEQDEGVRRTSGSQPDTRREPRISAEMWERLDAKLAAAEHLAETMLADIKASRRG